MRSSVISIALCVVVKTAAAQCVAQAPTAVAPVAVAPVTVTPITVAPAAKAPHAGGELIQTASAGTREGPRAFQSAAPARPESESHPRRTGSAMLLAALALMSGIALRRLNSRPQ
jgi:hypothetical protein